MADCDSHLEHRQSAKPVIIPLRELLISSIADHFHCQKRLLEMALCCSELYLPGGQSGFRAAACFL